MTAFDTVKQNLSPQNDLYEKTNVGAFETAQT